MKENKKIRIFKNNKWYAKLIRILAYLIVGSVYATYLIIRLINNIVAKLFMKLPRILKIAVVYSLIAVAIYGQVNVKTIIKEVVKEEELKIVFDKESLTQYRKQQEIIKEEVKTNDSDSCELGEIECKIYNKAKENGLSHEQSLIAISISRHETGNWTSRAFNDKHNFGGVMCSTGLKQYDDFEDGLNGFVNLLKNRYFNQGLDTIEKIGEVYCPVGASNDPTGVNIYWVPNVTQYYNEYLNK